MKTIKDLGEKKVIALLRNCLELPSTAIPFGDDVSAINIDNEKIAVLKTDMLIGKTDVPTGMTLKQAARKAVVMNISDFASKGVEPLAILVSLGLPKSTTINEINQIGIGLNEGAREYNTYIIGGDTNEASDLVINCSLFGICEKKFLIQRNGSKPGDILAVTGPFGNTAAGLEMINKQLYASKSFEDALLEAVFMPKARLKEGVSLARSGTLSASIDSSDGLACSLYELSDASNVGFIIDNLPIALKAKEFAEEYNFNSYQFVLYGGEEYELVLTVKAECWIKAYEISIKLGNPLIRIGKVTKDKGIRFKSDDNIYKVDRRGWEHFKKDWNPLTD